MGLKQLGRFAAAVTYNRGEHDRPVDIATPSSPRGGCGGFEEMDLKLAVEHGQHAVQAEPGEVGNRPGASARQLHPDCPR